MVASSPSVSQQTGWPIGFWAAELTHPLWVFQEAGYDIELVSTEGGLLQMDGYSNPTDPSGYSAHDVISLGYLQIPAFRAMLENTKKLTDVHPNNYVAIFLVGGQGPMYTFRGNKALMSRITFTESHAHQANYDKARSEHFKRVMVYRCIAWAHALRLHLRGQDSWDELQPFISEQEFQALLRVHNKPNYLHLLMGSHLYKAMADGTLGGFDSFQMEGQLLALANYQGSCERIKTTPLLRQYDYFTRLFLYVFIIVLPFALLGDFTKMGVSVMMIPTSLTIAFVFAVMGKVGEVNEDPFENRITDVPLTALCDTIERDLKELLGEHHALRQPIQAHNGYLL